ncbi:Glutamate receptor 1 [Portunus trituberculatus]|uniref:Glutamate receptor 1 n=1 Tax=Portunus trituberculatus TaxID=210409 RepID=A0A5B7I8Y1_PORTR|nr:Glutamate receptor 1 [Portunus trituberculatus]
MDERWEEDVKEFGAVNITGFRIVDTTRPYVRNFLNTWMSLDTDLFPGAGNNYISVSTCVCVCVCVCARASHVTPI